MSELRSQFTGALLVVLTVTAVICAGLNYQQQARYHLPDDGATWMDILHGEPPSQSQRVTAVHVESGGPAELAGIRTGDVLLRIAPVENSEPVPIREAIDVARILQRAGVWAKTTYILDRDVDGRGVEIEAKVIVADVNRDRALYFQYAVGAAYLVIGLFIFFRRNQARAALHFYLLCLVSFVQFAFHYTGKLNSFDTGVYVANVLAGLFAPALFVHFCLIFPDAGRRWGNGKPFRSTPRSSLSRSSRSASPRALSAPLCRSSRSAGFSTVSGSRFIAAASWPAAYCFTSAIAALRTPLAASN